MNSQDEISVVESKPRVRFIYSYPKPRMKKLINRNMNQMLNQNKVKPSEAVAEKISKIT
jgi:hypothetical protein